MAEFEGRVPESEAWSVAMARPAYGLQTYSHLLTAVNLFSLQAVL